MRLQSLKLRACYFARVSSNAVVPLLMGPSIGNKAPAARGEGRGLSQMGLCRSGCCPLYCVLHAIYDAYCACWSTGNGIGEHRLQLEIRELNVT